METVAWQENLELSNESLKSSSARAHRLLRDGWFWVGLGMFLALNLFCFAGPLVYRINPDAIHLSVLGHSPSARMPFGTDSLGRSELARLMWGGQPLILVGLTAALAASVVGIAVGLIAGFSGGVVDRAATWLTDVILSIPQLAPLLLIETLFKTSTESMIYVIAATAWPLVARPIRAAAMTLREREYVTAARSLGAGRFRIIIRHITPSLWSTLLTSVSISAGNAVLVVATVAFLGFALPPPAANWAGMIADSLNTIFSGYWWLLIFPGIAFVWLQLSINLIADAARSTLTNSTGVGS